MNKMTLALILSCLSFNCFAIDGNQFNKLSNNFQKGEFLKNKINKELLIHGTIESNQCASVSKFVKLKENTDILFLQVSCQNLGDDLQVLLPKKINLLSTVNTCKEAQEKYSAETRCRKKL
jgi:hypothetical protein